MEQMDASGNFMSRYGYNLGPGHTNLQWETSMGNPSAFPATNSGPRNDLSGSGEGDQLLRTVVLDPCAE